MSKYIASKCLFVGDSQVGKTCFVCTYLSGNFPNDPPVVKDPPIITVLYNDEQIKLQPWDTPGSQDYSALRSLSYPSSDIIIFCFSLVDPKSLDNIEKYWIPEVKKERPGKPYIIVGLKSDLRDDFAQHSELKQQGFEPISTEKGMKMKEKIGAQEYLECSSLKNENLKGVIETVIKVLIHQREIEDQNALSGSNYSPSEYSD